MVGLTFVVEQHIYPGNQTIEHILRTGLHHFPEPDWITFWYQRSHYINLQMYYPKIVLYVFYVYMEQSKFSEFLCLYKCH